MKMEKGCLETQKSNDGGSSSSSLSLSCRQMESLVALCDTFLPSINVSTSTMEMKVEDDDDSVTAFYRTSASMAQTPQQVAELITKTLKHPLLPILPLVLTLLSTRIGTFILCGRPSLSSHFPYLNKLSDVTQKGREEIAKSWSGSYFIIIRVLFLSMKMLTLLTFFSQVNNKGENLSWKAIDYKGPDPEFKTRESKHHNDNDNKDEIFGPLHRGIVNLTDYPPPQIAETLERSGFPVSIPDPKTKKLNSGSPYLVIKCDAVVVGSGSGGGVVAGVLAKAGYKVIVLEKGSYRARSNLSLLEGPTMNQMYLGSGLLATDDMGAVILAGATVGGGSTINWSASIRTPEHVRHEWCEQYGLKLFQSDLYKEALDIVCEKMGVQTEVENEGFCNSVLRRGCMELGYPVINIPRNSTADHCCGWCCFGCKDGSKKGVNETWLMEMVKSGNGVILPQCEAIRVTTKKGNRNRQVASGVAFEFGNRGATEICVVESKVTVVACGALSTPSLLRNSGLKNPDIGKNLHVHPVTMAWGYFPDTPKKCYEGGIMTAMSTVVANFATSGYGAVIQTPSLHPGMFSVLTPWVSGVDIKDRMMKFSRTAHIFALARDKGSGRISSPSSISYKLEKFDEENLQNGIEKVLRILAAAGAEEIGTQHRCGRSLNVRKASVEEFENFVKEESGREMKGLEAPICSAHQMGSCRMGIDRKVSAVNQMGETWEVEGLYVADSSVFPTALGVNPMVTVQAIAYCTAQSVIEALQRKSNNKIKILNQTR